MVKLAALCLEQYGGMLCDVNGPIDGPAWLSDRLSHLKTKTIQEDMLSA